MARVEEICRKHGVTLTVQRRIVLEELSARKDHPTADQVFSAVSRKVPEISRTTVYRVLEKFVRLGIARLVCHPGAATRYELWTRRHHHLVCTRCESIVDLEDSSLDGLCLPTPSVGFTVEDYSIHFRGVCARCARKPPAGRDAASMTARAARSAAQSE